MKFICVSICKLKDHVKVSYYHYNLWRKKKRGWKQGRQRMQKKKWKKRKMMVLDRMASKKFLSLKFCDFTEKEKIKSNIISYVKSSHLSKKMIQNYVSTRKSYSFFTY